MDSFIIIRLADTKTEIEIPEWRKKLPQSLYQKYLFKALPIGIKEAWFCGETGKVIILPFTRLEMKNCETDCPALFMNAIIQKYDLDHVYIAKEDRIRLGCGQEGRGWLLNFLLLPDIIERVMKHFNLNYKTLYPVILDSGDRRTESILEWMVPRLNHLKIITDRPAHFTDFTDLVYEETGLMTEIIEMPVKTEIAGNLILDPGIGSAEIYRCFPKKAVVVAPAISNGQLRYLSGRRADLLLVHEFTVSMRNETPDRELAEIILCGQNWKLRQFMNHIGGLSLNDQCGELKSRYGLVLENVKWPIPAH